MSTELTTREVIRSVGWLDAMNGAVEFDEADWSGAPTVVLRGYTTEGQREHVEAVFTLVDFAVFPNDGEE